MPSASPRPCRHPGCGTLVADGSGYCQRHQADKALGKFADAHRGSRHDRGYGSAWVRRRERILRRDCGLCQPCLQAGRPTPAAAVDHKVNKAEWKRVHGSLTGVDADENLQAICNDCHAAKTAQEAKDGRGGGRGH